MHDELEAVEVMPAVGHQLADVVQHRRRFEQSAFFRCAAEGLGQLIVEGEGEQADLFDMPAFPVTAIDEFAVQSQFVSRLLLLLGAYHLQQQPFAQAIGAHRQLADVEHHQQFGGDHQSGEDDVGALRIQSAHQRPLFGVHGAQPFQQRLDLSRAHGRAVDGLPDYAAPCRRHPREIGECPAGADQRPLHPVVPWQRFAE